jgi:uncharacterized protein with HEPN domain
LSKDETVYIRHILDAIARIERYLAGISYDLFNEDTLVQDGVIRQLEIIGEASKRLSDDTKASYVDIPWKDIAGMRDKLIHDYFGTDIKAVWDTAKDDVPDLKGKLS